MCVDVQDVYEIKKEKMLLGKKLMFIALDFDINIHALQATDGNH
jgi:hypothetical protein